MSINEKKKVWVVGHKNPDTDSICAAIAYANLKNHHAYTRCRFYRGTLFPGTSRPDHQPVERGLDQCTLSAK